MSPMQNGGKKINLIRIFGATLFVILPFVTFFAGTIYQQRITPNISTNTVYASLIPTNTIAPTSTQVATTTPTVSPTSTPISSSFDYTNWNTGFLGKNLLLINILQV